MKNIQDFYIRHSNVIFRILLGIVILGKIANKSLNLPVGTNQVLDTIIFCTIGVTYLFFSWAFDKVLLKSIFGICGVYLILMNFMDSNSWTSIIGLICILTPMIIARFLPQNVEEKQ